MDKRPVTEQLTIWGYLDVWQGAHVKRIRLPEKLTTLRQKLYRKAKLEPKFRFYIRDRVVQTAALLILEPIFEADFMDCSYGFRPNRSAHDALDEDT